LPPAPVAGGPVARRWFRRAAGWALRVAEAVEFMHQRGVYHRDLKPSNILLDGHDHPKVTDFGLAVLVAAGRTPSGPGWAGTAEYTAPELVGEDAAPPGPEDYRRADVYSLGAVLYALLTGRPPFRGETVQETLAAVRGQVVTPPRRLNPRVPRALEAVCLRCLSKDPRGRFPSAGAVAAALREYLSPRSPLRVLLAVLLAAVSGLLVWQLYAGHRTYQERVNDLTVKAEEAVGRGSGLAGQEALEALTDARTFYRQLQRESPPDPLGLERKVAQLTRDLGLRYRQNYNPAAAAREFREAQRLYAALAEARPGEPEWGASLADALHWEGVALLDEKKHAEAWKRFEDSRRVVEALPESGESGRGRLRLLARCYGWRGDVELELNRVAEAKNSYDTALSHRETILSTYEGGTAVERYEYARSLGNTGYYHDWVGEFEQAVEAYKNSNKSLAECPPPPSDEFNFDLADGLMGLAELELDRPGTPRQQEIGQWLLRAGQDYERYGSPPGRAARLRAARGKFLYLTGQPRDARGDLGEAVGRYNELIVENRDQPQDMYRLAQCHAVLARLAADAEQRDYHEVAALLRLREAVQRGFLHLRKVERDRAFEALRGRRAYCETLCEVTRRRGPDE
jgi:hypothetical protein